MNGGERDGFVLRRHAFCWVDGFCPVAGFCYPYWPIQVTNINKQSLSRAQQRTAINNVTCTPTILLASIDTPTSDIFPRFCWSLVHNEMAA